MSSVEVRRWRRVPAVEFRAAGDGTPPVLSAAAAVFGALSQNMGGWVERIDPAAFNDTLARGSDILCTLNHEFDVLLGTTGSGTLTVEATETELRYACELDLLDPDGLRVARKAETGKLRGSSFCFRVLPDGETWSVTDQGFPLRTITHAQLFELGPVSMPAYPATGEGDAAVALRGLASRINEPVDRLLAAARSNGLAQFVAPPAAEPLTVPEQPSRSADIRMRQIGARTIS